MIEPLISIIVPVYNPGEYLYNCLRSLVKQTERNYEVILVDDGSTDGSAEICKEYCKKYDNIQYFYKENSGVSDTRNFGIEKSRGEYIAFVDSDDYIDEKYTEKAEEIIKQDYEMIIFNHAMTNGDTIEELVLIEESQDVTCPKVLNKYFETYCLSTACKMLYKKDLLAKNNIKFDKSISYGEDMLFSIEAYLNSKKTYYSNYCAYFYVINESSATYNGNIEKRKKYVFDNLALYKQIGLMLEKSNVEVDRWLFLDALLRNFFYGLNSLCLSVSSLRQESIKEVLEAYKPFLSEYNKEKSKLDFKLKMHLDLLKQENLLLLGIYLKFKRIIIKIKTCFCTRKSVKR